MKALNYKSVIFTIGSLAIVFILGFWAWGEYQDNKMKPDQQNEGALAPKNDATKPGPSNQTQPPSQNRQEPRADSQTGKVVNINVSAKPFEFNPKEIRVKQGDTVRVVLSNTEGFHDWVLDEFNARTPRLNAGQTASVTFTANQKGTFEYYCSVGNHRQMGMTGKLIVE